MIARVVRNSVDEAVHDGVVVVADSSGQVMLSTGDIDRPYFLRSAAKPFQARASQMAGAGLEPEGLAVAAASHGGQPAHVALVERMLADVGLSVESLRCPPAWPIATSARRRLIGAGHSEPRRVWHNCSGKHAAMLRACVAQAWPVERYLDPLHPLQESVAADIAGLIGRPVGPPGVDGCGAPVWSVSTVELARLYAVLGHSPDYATVWQSMHRFPALTSDREYPSVALARWTEVAAKHGAEGVLALATRRDLGIAIKSWDGAIRPLGPVALAVMEQLGAVPSGTAPVIADELAVPVLGGGDPVGRVEATVTQS